MQIKNIEDMIGKRGGKRKNAGRKPADYKTTTISVRVRVDWVNDLKKTISNKILELKSKT